MKVKVLKCFSVIMNILLSMLMVFSIGAVAFILVGNFVTDISPISFVYLLFGEAILPIEQLINGTVGQFPTALFNIVTIATGASLFVLSVLGLTFFSRAYKDKKGVKTKVLIPSLIIALLLCSFFTFSLISLITNYDGFNNFLSLRISGSVKVILQYLGNNFIILKSIIFAGLIAVFALLVFVTCIICKQKGEKKEKNVSNILFYSEEYLRVQKEAKPETNKKKPTQAQMAQMVKSTKKLQKKQSQALINKIMQLNELKDSGKINEVEYTRLRQKAIRRYKG